MDRVAGRPDGAELRRLRRLVELTIVATLLLVVVGGFVRVSESGLGCGPAGSGTDGWPLCDGRVVPLIDEKTLIEFSHRLLASIVVVLIGLSAWRARRLGAKRRLLKRGTVAAGLLVLGQAVLGGLTVEKNLEEYLVAAHLGLAMLLLAILLALRWATRPESSGEPEASPGEGLRPLAIGCTVLVLATIVAGGYMAGTEEEGIRNGVVNGAHLACGEEFPGCLGGVLPFGRHGHLVDVQLAHRALVYATTAAILVLLGLALYLRAFSREFALLGGLLAAQFLLGALNIWLGKHPGLIVAHLTVGTLLWAAAVNTTLRLSPAPAPRTEPGPTRAESAAAPA